MQGGGVPMRNWRYTERDMAEHPVEIHTSAQPRSYSVPTNRTNQTRPAPSNP